ncbi:MAG: response regulator [Bacteroidia bacterium]|nr:response regulator [Bacteroidia bacterium]
MSETRSLNSKIIFIVEDNEAYAKALKQFLQTRFAEIKEVKIFHIGELCLPELDLNPFIVVMDYFLNSRYNEANNGLEIAERIKIVKPKTNIILLSVQENSIGISEIIKQYDCMYIKKNEAAFEKVGQSVEAMLSAEDQHESDLLN